MIRILLATALLFAVASPVEAQSYRRCYRPLFGIFVTPCRDRDYSIPEREPMRKPPISSPSKGTGLSNNGLGGSVGGSINVGGDSGVSVNGGVSVGGKSIGGGLSIGH